jgi:adenosylmethionine-8-amino-7-oxononanoate aminotransferase
MVSINETNPSSKPQASFPTVSHGQGVWLYDVEGKNYLDGCSGAIVSNLGHGNQAIVEAQAAQGRKISFAFRSQMDSLPNAELRAKVLSKCPGYTQVLFYNSGSEAIEAALRLSRLYWVALNQPAKTQVLSRTISYHGMTEGALRVSGHNERRQVLAHATLSQPLVPTSYCFRCPFQKTPGACQTECGDELGHWVDRIGENNVAAFLFEPVIGASGGAINGPTAYFQKIREIATDRNVLLIADEVMTGFGRLGEWLGLERWGITADITVTGKGLGAGYTPISALLISEKVWKVICARPGLPKQIFGHTYGGNPVSCATAIEVMRQIESQDVMGNVRAKSPRLRDILRALMADHPSIIIDVRGEGFLWGLELARKGDAEALTSAAMHHGLMIYPCTGFLGVGKGDAMLVAPPLNITDGELDELETRLRNALATLEKSK